MRCQRCGAEFEAKTVRRKFCSSACRAGAWQAGREHELALMEEGLTRSLERVRRQAKG